MPARTGVLRPGYPKKCSSGPLSEAEPDDNLHQRVGGRAGTAVSQGTVCELPNPVNFLPLSAKSAPRSVLNSRLLRGPPNASNLERLFERSRAASQENKLLHCHWLSMQG